MLEDITSKPLLMPLPCPFCGGLAQWTKDFSYVVVNHDSWECHLAKASNMVFQIIEPNDVVEWNERTNERY